MKILLATHTNLVSAGIRNADIATGVGVGVEVLTGGTLITGLTIYLISSGKTVNFIDCSLLAGGIGLIADSAIRVYHLIEGN